MAASQSTWTYLSNHAHVLLCLAHEPTARLRDVAERVGITERAVQTIVSDLEASGAITRIREGRRNRYRLHHQIGLRHPVEAHCTIGDLIAMTGLPVAGQASGSRAAGANGHAAPAADMSPGERR